LKPPCIHKQNIHIAYRQA